MLAIDGAGVAAAYREMWLGAAESGRLTAGGEAAAIDVDGWRLGLAICQDTGGARHAADTAALGIDADVAGVLGREDDAHVPDERARRVTGEHARRVCSSRRPAPAQPAPPILIRTRPGA
jgi:predicted amidohydrolase